MTDMEQVEKLLSEARQSVQKHFEDLASEEEKEYKRKLRKAKDDYKEIERIEREHSEKLAGIKKEEEEKLRQLSEHHYKQQGEAVQLRIKREQDKKLKEQLRVLDLELEAYQETSKERKKLTKDEQSMYEKLSKKREDVKKEIEENARAEEDLEETMRIFSRSRNKDDRDAYSEYRHMQSEKKKEEKKAHQKELDAIKQRGEESIEQLKMFKGNINDVKDAVKGIGVSLLQNVIGKIGNQSYDKITEYIEDALSHRRGMLSRLQSESGEYDYSSMLDTVQSAFAASPYIKQKDFLDRLDKAVDTGIAYNVEQRTFLSMISDSIANTFDAFDSNLTRLIRLQQADSTAARLGMEASLTKTFNTLFKDTSYLGSKGGGGLFDSISATLLDVEATMTRNAAAEFEFIVQKWLGAMYSIGMSQETVSQIAKGLSYIGTGNVQAMAGSTPLQTLFSMSASRAQDLDYADLFVGGLNAKKTNKLLESMVKYLQEIATTSSNNVVRAAYGDIYQMSQADIRAVSSLTPTEIANISNIGMSYTGMIAETSSQLKNISNRFSMGEMIQNITDNFIYTIGSDIASSAAEYTLWTIADTVQKATGGIHLPAVSIMGNMIDLSAFTVEGILKTSLVGLSTIAEIGSIFKSIGGSNVQAGDVFEWEQYLTRGTSEREMAGSTISTSGSVFVGSGSAEDIKKGAIAETMEGAEDVQSAEMQPEHTFDDFYDNVFVDDMPINVLSADDYTTSDLYKSMFVAKNPITVSLDSSNGLGLALMTLSNSMTMANKVFDVNIKKSDAQVKTVVADIDQRLKEEIRAYIRNTYLDQLTDAVKSAIIGNGNTSIAQVCDKIVNDVVGVKVTNDYFDEAVQRYSMYGMM